MARYIDAEKVDLKGVAVFDENLDVLVPLSDVRKALQMTPTADVVPKSEVERLTKELDVLAEEHSDLIVEKDQLFDEVLRLRKSLSAYEETSGLKKAKAEVAREIFEKIEILLCLNSLQGDVFTGTYFGVELETDIAELKKKYTEENNNEN